ncbi:AI-2E family transporter [Candidatus Parcubacteria bacterium]|nr:MAG: AI-2E family transporter [Candidatus Parcubacteria bacterium]
MSFLRLSGLLARERLAACYTIRMPQRARPVSLTIAPSTIALFVAVGLGLWALWLLRDVVLIVLTSIVLASAISPAVARLEAMRLPRALAVLMVYLGFFGVLGLAGVYLLPLVFRDIASLLAVWPQYVAGWGDFAIVSAGEAASSISQLESVVRELGQNASASPAGVVEVLSAAFGGLLSFVLIVVFSFYFAVEERGLNDFISLLAPPEWRDRVLRIWARSQRKMGQWLQGQLVLVVLVATITYLLLAIFGVRHALALALLAGILEIIPIFGPILAAVPAVGLAYLDGGVPLALTIGAGYLLIQQFENHLIYPLVVTKVVGVPPILVILALVVGAQLAGFLGIVLAVPVAAALQEGLAELRRLRSAGLAQQQRAAA